MLKKYAFTILISSFILSTNVFSNPKSEQYRAPNVTITSGVVNDFLNSPSAFSNFEVGVTGILKVKKYYFHDRKKPFFQIEMSDDSGHALIWLEFTDEEKISQSYNIGDSIVGGGYLQSKNPDDSSIKTEKGDLILKANSVMNTSINKGVIKGRPINTAAQPTKSVK